jgi:hypothetical protein
MNKKILSGIFALALLATAGYGVNKSMKSDANLSDLALANVEALAQSEYYRPDGICYGAGANFTDVHCPGGYTTCCWAHTHVYGKN